MGRAGVTVKCHHTDNGIFNAEAFNDSVEESGQELTFSGACAHHQNGVSERAVMTTAEKSRTLMMHLAIHWPEEFSMKLWPFAMDHVAFLCNHTPCAAKEGTAPLEKHARARCNCKAMRRAKVWECLFCVLDRRLVNGKRMPKFEQRARHGQFLGFSTRHASWTE